MAGETPESSSCRWERLGLPFFLLVLADCLAANRFDFLPCLFLVKCLGSDYSRRETRAANAERHALGWALSYWSRTWSLARWV